MELHSRDYIRVEMNKFGSAGEPFIFMLDFKAERGMVMPIEALKKSNIACSIAGVELGRTVVSDNENINFEISPIDIDTYRKKFNNVTTHIKHGDSYLLNLTFPTHLGKDLNLNNIYSKARAPYKLLFEDKFLFYSPEPFIRINNNRIYSFPMKGTIDATLPDAERTIMENKKELYEHYTIVDLIRNDLSIVASNVGVDRFRYVERVNTILQTSSQISGDLPQGWEKELGDLILKLLPAGSVSGAPKEMTVKIIEESEISERGFYTGVMGIFDGKSVDSCVIIRYIERDENNNFYYRSGGGITSGSIMEDEYNELISKIYVPLI